jgi:hypothetical protein
MLDSAMMTGSMQMEDRRTPGMEIVTARIGALIDDLTKAAEVIEARTAPVRLVVPRPAPEDGAHKRSPGSDLANHLHGYADQLERILGQLQRLSQEIDL